MTKEEMDRLLQAYGSGASAGEPAPPAGKPAERSMTQRVISGVEDVGRSIQTGLARGVIGTPGAPADIVRLGQAARDYIRSTNIGGPSQGTYAEVRAREDAKREAEQAAVFKPSNLQEYGSQRFVERGEAAAPGEFIYEPTTAPGRAVALPAEMAGGAITGGVMGGMRGGARGLASTAVRSGVVPGAAVTGAQALGVENPVLLGAIGIGAGGAAEAARTRSAAGALQGRTAGATDAQIAQAEALFQAALVRCVSSTPERGGACQRLAAKRSIQLRRCRRSRQRSGRALPLRCRAKSAM